MTVTACPAALIEAPIDRVWALVVDPHAWSAWSGARFEAADPAGPIRVGQRWRLSAPAFGRRWPVRVRVVGVAPAPPPPGFSGESPAGRDGGPAARGG
jgi:hypothetical protein